MDDVGDFMDGRSIALMLAMTVAGSALTGCIQNPEWFNTNAAEVSAFQNMAAADGAAAAWSAEAKLIGVMAFELSQTPDPRIDSDPDPGNGLAPAWWYVYVGGKDAKSEVRAFKVTSDGTVSSEKDAETLAMGVDHDSAAPIEGWVVDSDAALATAKANASFAKVAQGFNATVIEGVAQETGSSDGPTWWFSAMSADGFVVATVSAVTGKLIEVTSLDADFEMPDFEWGAANPAMMGSPVHLEGDGALASGDEAAAEAFAVTGPVLGTFMIDFSPSMPADGLHWAILDADGEAIAEEHMSSWRGSSDSHEIDVEIMDAGEYTLKLSYMSAFGPGFLPVNPLGGSVEYSYVLHLMPGASEHEKTRHS